MSVLTVVHGTDEILGAILPGELLDGAPSGFAATGHIGTCYITMLGDSLKSHFMIASAHLNLNDEYLPYKHLIGQVILDVCAHVHVPFLSGLTNVVQKNKGVKTVVNKLNSIDTKFRFFKMELLAGEPNYVVEHVSCSVVSSVFASLTLNSSQHESNCVFSFDFTKVYWNSRLHTEHDRLVQLFSPDDVVADAFAGVGPFALPAAKKGCGVLANDLNPESYKWLSRNIENNKVWGLV